MSICLFYRKGGEGKIDSKRHVAEVIIGMFGNMFSLAYYRVDTIDTALNDLQPASRIFDILGCDIALRLQLANTKSHMRYLVGPRTLVFCAKMRSLV